MYKVILALLMITLISFAGDGYKGMDYGTPAAQFNVAKYSGPTQIKGTTDLIYKLVDGVKTVLFKVDPKHGYYKTLIWVDKKVSQADLCASLVTKYGDKHVNMFYNKYLYVSNAKVFQYPVRLALGVHGVQWDSGDSKIIWLGRKSEIVTIKAEKMETYIPLTRSFGSPVSIDPKELMVLMHEKADSIVNGVGEGEFGYLSTNIFVNYNKDIYTVRPRTDADVHGNEFDRINDDLQEWLRKQGLGEYRPNFEALGSKLHNNPDIYIESKSITATMKSEAIAEAKLKYDKLISEMERQFKENNKKATGVSDSAVDF